MMSENGYGSLPENPYAPPASMSEVPVSPDTGSPEEQDLRAFFGPKADHYLDLWRRRMTNPRQSLGFNWAAFFLTGLWLGYRKMYTVVLVFFAVILVESIAEEVLFVRILGEEESPMVVSKLVTLVASIICGKLGNHWYLTHAANVVSEVRATGLEDREVRGILAKRGGTSLLSSIGLIVLYVFVTFVVFVLLAPFIYPPEVLLGP